MTVISILSQRLEYVRTFQLATASLQYDSDADKWSGGAGDKEVTEGRM